MSSEVDTDSVMTCAACGASIYQEHLHRGMAGLWAGQLLCPACLRQKRDPDGTAEGEDQFGPVPLTEPLIPNGEAAVENHNGFSTAEAMVGAAPYTGTGARRIRTFHAKLNEGAVRHMDEQINKWLAQHPQIEIKFAQTVVGVWEAKHAEPNLIVTIFY
jgi:hypothetical protein